MKDQVYLRSFQKKGKTLKMVKKMKTAVCFKVHSWVSTIKIVFSIKTKAKVK